MPRKATAQASQQNIISIGAEKRRNLRYPVQYRLRYTGKIGSRHVRGEGVLVDVSLEGCGIQGSCPVEQGHLLTLQIDLPQKNLVMTLEHAIVRWASGGRFGIESPECSRLAAQLGLVPAVND
ncbi:MAG: PilZ domain-containing protein [Nitrospiraceae bacterium]